MPFISWAQGKRKYKEAMLVVKVLSVEFHDEAWEVRFEIKEGVYRLESYPVRITHLGHFEGEDFKEDVATLAMGLLQGHMRRGAVPPHAVVINWSRVAQLSEHSSVEVKEARERISQRRYSEQNTEVSNQF